MIRRLSKIFGGDGIRSPRDTVRELSEKGPIRAGRRGLSVALGGVKGMFFGNKKSMIEEELDAEVYTEYIESKTITEFPSGAEYRHPRETTPELDGVQTLEYQLWHGGEPGAGILVAAAVDGEQTLYGTIETDGKVPKLNFPESVGKKDVTQIPLGTEDQYRHVQTDFHAIIRRIIDETYSAIDREVTDGSDLQTPDSSAADGDGVTIPGTPTIEIRPWREGAAVYMAWRIGDESGMYGSLHKQSVVFKSESYSGVILPESAVERLKSQAIEL